MNTTTFPMNLSSYVLVACIKRFNLYGVCTGVMQLAIEYVTSVEYCLFPLNSERLLTQSLCADRCSCCHQPVK